MAVKKAVVEPVVAEVKAPVKIVRIIGGPKKAYQGDSARDCYWQRFKQFNGKPLADLEASCQEKCPKVTKQGIAEAFGGWLGFFTNDQKTVKIEEKK
jgi:hypothetical protein